MNNQGVGAIHRSFWVIGAVALIWNFLGIVNFLGQLNAGVVAAMPDTHRAIIVDRPLWATGGFAVAVFAGTLGCLLLLLRKSTAFYLLLASLLGVITTMLHTLSIASSNVDFSFFEIFMMILMPVVVAGLLVWYSLWTRGRGWIS